MGTWVMRRFLCNVEDEAVKNTQVHDVLPRRAVQTSLDVGAGDEAGPGGRGWSDEGRSANAPFDGASLRMPKRGRGTGC